MSAVSGLLMAGLAVTSASDSVFVEVLGTTWGRILGPVVWGSGAVYFMYQAFFGTPPAVRAANVVLGLYCLPVLIAVGVGAFFATDALGASRGTQLLVVFALMAIGMFVIRRIQRSATPPPVEPPAT